MVFRTIAIESIATTPYSHLLYTLGKPKQYARIGKAVKWYATNHDIQMAAAIRAAGFSDEDAADCDCKRRLGTNRITKERRIKCYV